MLVAAAVLSPASLGTNTDSEILSYPLPAKHYEQALHVTGISEFDQYAIEGLDDVQMARSDIVCTIQEAAGEAYLRGRAR